MVQPHFAFSGILSAQQGRTLFFRQVIVSTLDENCNILAGDLPQAVRLLQEATYLTISAGNILLTNIPIKSVKLVQRRMWFRQVEEVQITVSADVDKLHRGQLVQLYSVDPTKDCQSQ